MRDSHRRRRVAHHSRQRQIGFAVIIPIVINLDYAGAMGRYALAPEVFKAFQCCHAPAGKISDGLKAALLQQLRTLRRARMA